MKTVAFSDIFTMKLAFTDISVIYQTNNWSVCNNTDGRKMNGFLLVDRGCCKYIWQNGKAELQRGALIYLPKGSRHLVEAEERSLNFYRINFTITDLADGEEVVLCEEPWPVMKDASKGVFGICEDMLRATLSEGGTFRSLSLLAELLDLVGHTVKRSFNGRIGAAIEYIEGHYTEEADIAELASMCYISEAHLFRLFKSEIGMSPVEYKNALRIRKAEELLLDRECSITEISTLLGFENACYFSRVFKKIIGMSPLEYRKNKS